MVFFLKKKAFAVDTDTKFNWSYFNKERKMEATLRHSKFVKLQTLYLSLVYNVLIIEQEENGKLSSIHTDPFTRTCSTSVVHRIS